MKPQFDIHFVDGPCLEYISGDDPELQVNFVNQKNNVVEYSENIKIGQKIKIDKVYFVDWILRFYKEGNLVHEQKINCRGRRVFIAIESNALGDTLAWVPFFDVFRKKHKCKLIVSTFYNYLFEDQYRWIEFVQPDVTVYDLYALYRIGIFYEDHAIDLNRNVHDIKKFPLQKVASDILGLEAVELKPKLSLNKNIKKEKLITIGIHGSAQTKYWNRKNGWQEVIDYVIQKGYQVKLLSKECNHYMGNRHPTGITQLASGSLAEVIAELQKSSFFIGIGSGLSWLSWATNTPTILISGFSEKYSEFQNSVYRVAAPSGACSGCFNKVRLDANNWNWCPEHEKTARQFECTTLITAQSVIDQIDLIIGESPVMPAQL